jgi:hypothetical protein
LAVLGKVGVAARAKTREPACAVAVKRDLQQGV